MKIGTELDDIRELKYHGLMNSVVMRADTGYFAAFLRRQMKPCILAEKVLICNAYSVLHPSVFLRFGRRNSQPSVRRRFPAAAGSAPGPSSNPPHLFRPKNPGKFLDKKLVDRIGQRVKIVLKIQLIAAFHENCEVDEGFHGVSLVSDPFCC